jgi:hypothetical protein
MDSDADRQAQKGVHVALVQELAPHDLARAALEEHVVGHDDRRAAILIPAGTLCGKIVLLDSGDTVIDFGTIAFLC